MSISINGLVAKIAASTPRTFVYLPFRFVTAPKSARRLKSQTFSSDHVSWIVPPELARFKGFP